MKKTVSVIDAVGLKCPEPVMLLHSAVRDAKPGERILLTATDPSSQKDIAEFCEFLGHQLVSMHREGEKMIFVVSKGSV